MCFRGSSRYSRASSWHEVSERLFVPLAALRLQRLQLASESVWHPRSHTRDGTIAKLGDFNVSKAGVIDNFLSRPLKGAVCFCTETSDFFKELCLCSLTTWHTGHIVPHHVTTEFTSLRLSLQLSLQLLHEKDILLGLEKARIRWMLAWLTQMFYSLETLFCVSFSLAGGQARSLHDANRNTLLRLTRGLAGHAVWCSRPSFAVRQKTSAHQIALDIGHRSKESWSVFEAWSTSRPRPKATCGH